MVDDKWESPLHRTRIELRLKLNTGHTYAVNIGYSFKFTINRETAMPIDLNDLTRPLSQPEVIALVDFEIETRPRETQVDRSYASLGFVAYRTKSIIQRTFLDRGFNLPDRFYKRGEQQQNQRGIKATAGISQGGPLATAALSYNQNNDTTLEATDSKVMPRCRVVSEPGDAWNEDCRSYSSYNIGYWAQDVRLSAERPEFRPLEVKVGMGINLRPPGSKMPLPQISFVNRNQVLIWVSDPTSKARIRGVIVLTSSYLHNIRTEEELSIYEHEEIKLGTENSNRPKTKTEENTGETISVSIAQVQNQAASGGSNTFLAAVPNFIAKRGRGPSGGHLTDISPNECLARGWDATNNEWRKVLWPALNKDFRAADFADTPGAPVWNIQCPWRKARTTNGTNVPS
ncbi:hypothetical protein DFH08DRAFT_897150 [Mycena albidolilacea]|uniref:Uncharacterized protein n=1 Tax=Mycena albidolilacea TaxID=1033008 RepID=A0AAD7ECP2_9AGAR|nr:hypothetical protein DFH08DRAFT_897150 [Mycena albidolilacea]